MQYTGQRRRIKALPKARRGLINQSTNRKRLPMRLDKNRRITLIPRFGRIGFAIKAVSTVNP
jgi:hypothetical protein